MNLEEIEQRLKETGIPFAYRAFPPRKAPPLPFLIYLIPYSNNFAADGEVYYPINHIQIELYTKRLDRGAVEKIEKALQGIYWEKTELYLDDEQMYETIYEIEG